MTSHPQQQEKTFSIDPSILRAYDIRGTIGEGLDPEVCYAVGRAFGTYVVRELAGRTVCVAFDGRETSPAFAKAVRQGLSDCGLSVYDLGLGPTPMAYYGMKELDCDAAVMVTGSHSAVTMNGIKMALRTGPFWGDRVQELGTLIANNDFESGEGQIETLDIHKKYVDRLVYDLKLDRPINAVWDCGNGAAGAVIEDFVSRLPGEHKIIFGDVDGTFPNHHPDPTVDKNLVDLQKEVIDGGYDIGIGFDGDADRIGVVGSAGEVYRADILIAIYARDVLRNHPDAAIVSDVKSSNVLFNEIERLGGRPILAPTGHSVIKARMIEERAPLGGELAGHICFADIFYGHDDGLYCAVRLLNILSRTEDGFKALTGHLPKVLNTPEHRVPVPEDRKFDIPREVATQIEGQEGLDIVSMDGIRVTTPHGWWLLRASNTEAVLSVRAESETQEGLDRLQSDVEAALKSVGVDFSF